uniref:PH domain-containing protein n=1 Tax=Elaeophora elaphi TaxID=1147741 RepID=A0A0R3S4I7_9BILA
MTTVHADRFKMQAIYALVNDEWIRLQGNSKGNQNVAQLDDNSSIRSDDYYNYVSPFIRADRCKGVGIRHFWRTAKFGSFVDVKGVYHTTYHFDGKVLVDCITPLVANLFYVLIAFCFVIVVKSTLACILNVISTSSGFLNWLKWNTILEMSSMILAVLSCIITVVVGAMIYSVNPFSGVTVGAGSVLIAVSGVSSFFAAVVSLRRKYHVARQRRLENQRLLCARSLRSWREVVRRSEDMRPIIDFERYLDSWATSIDSA